jgi:integrase
LNAFSKGRKERISPLWPETVDLLHSLLQRRPRKADEPIFANRYGHPLGASGVRYKLRKYLKTATLKTPTLATKRVSPHTFRHTMGTHLAAAKVDVTVIRDWMGHAHLDTTLRYLQSSVETKREALDRIQTPAERRKAPRWKRDTSVLAWLDSL